MSDELHEEFGLERDELDAFEALAPPAGFSHGVLRANRPKPRRINVWLVAALALLMAGGTLALFLKTSGSLHAAERTAGEAGPVVWVAEAGAQLDWTLGRGGGVITQDAGEVFYRVDTPADVVVRTPSADVRVVGTCFRVRVRAEDEEMQSTSKIRRPASVAALAGAALGALVTVVVYEGEVAFANEHGEVEVHAGEVATAEPGNVPSLNVVPHSGSAESAQEGGPSHGEPTAVERDRVPLDALIVGELRAEAARLRVLSDAQQAELARLREQSEEHVPLSRRQWYPSSQSELAALAERCVLRVDTPPVMGIEAGQTGEYADRLGLVEGEAEALDDAIARVHNRFRAALGSLYEEATGDPAGDLSPQAMLAELRDKGVPGEVSEIYQRIAQERAGLASPPPESGWGLAERAYRLYAEVPDDLQATLAASLGAERAHDIRSSTGGWPWQRSEFSGCPDE